MYKRQGLSYLRTHAVMENHPLHGPQAHRAPVLARVLRPRNSALGTQNRASLGVGGFVTEDSVSMAFNSDRSAGSRLAGNQQMMGGYDPDKMSNAIDADLAGGNKMWVHPMTASVDERGRIRLELSRGDKEAVAVKTGNVDLIHEARAASTRGMMSSVAFPMASSSSSSSLPEQGTQRNANYGTRLPDHSKRGYSPPSERRGGVDYSSALSAGQQRTPPPYRRSGVQGFDEELKRRGEQGAMDDETATSRIRDLLASRVQREGGRR